MTLLTQFTAGNMHQSLQATSRFNFDPQYVLFVHAHSLAVKCSMTSYLQINWFCINVAMLPGLSTDFPEYNVIIAKLKKQWPKL